MPAKSCAGHRVGTERDTAKEGCRAVTGLTGLGGDQDKCLTGFLGVSARISRSLEAHVQKAQSLRELGPR